MKARLLRRIRREARNIFEDKLSVFGTTNGEVTRLRYDTAYKWAFGWMFFHRLDYHEDRRKIVHKIARLYWKREARDVWRKKIKAKKGANDGSK